MDSPVVLSAEPDWSSTARRRAGPGNVSIVTPALGVAKTLRALLGLKLAPLGLMSGQDRLLVALHERGRMNVSTLADEMSVRPSTVSKMADRLLEKGLIARSVDPGDGRKTDVALTEDGMRLCRDLGEVLERLNDDLVSSLSVEEARTVSDGLEVLGDVVARRLRKLR